jgi:hypothetical protein
MIKYYFKSLRSERMQELENYKPGCWVYVEAPNESEIEHLVKKFDIVEGHLRDALDEDEMPRLEKGASKAIFSYVSPTAPTKVISALRRSCSYLAATSLLRFQGSACRRSMPL